MSVLEVFVQGSAHDPYAIRLSRKEGQLVITCTCPAGAIGNICKHRVALLRGDVSAVCGGDDLAHIPDLIKGTAVERALVAVDEAEEALSSAKAELNRRKKLLADRMERG